MKARFLPLFIIFISTLSYGQDCPSLLIPQNPTNVPVNTEISWTSVEGVAGYIISIGTTPGGNQIVSNQAVGNATSFTPPLGLPDNTQIYVTITLFFLNIAAITCPSFSFVTEDIITAPLCTMLDSPVNGSIEINVASNLSWNYAVGATGYRLSIGTSPGLGDIVNNLDVGNVLSYNPISDFPTETTIYVQIIPYNENGSASGCIEESFTTDAPAVLPICTSLISPANGATNVLLSPLLEWTEIPNATGYIVSIGTSPFIQDILQDGVFFKNSTFVLNFEPNRTFFIIIIPFNDAGEAIGCGQESFSTILGCGPFFDADTGELINLFPEINFIDTIVICENTTTTITSNDAVDGFRWFRINSDGSEVLLSETAEVLLSDDGDYRYEAYNLIEQSGNLIECMTEQEFEVLYTASQIATINSVDITNQQEGLQLIVNISGSGDYEFSLNNIDGPYQESNLFENVAEGQTTVFVRDKNGCGIAERTVKVTIPLDFPKFFTPNGDGFNDVWQYEPPLNSQISISSIYIFDRQGKFIRQIDPKFEGWDGTFIGKRLPASDYWYKAVTLDGAIVKGHFTLKR